VIFVSGKAKNAEIICLFRVFLTQHGAKSAKNHTISGAEYRFLIREDDEVVYGDAGYCGIEKREEIKQDTHLSQIDWRINLQKPYRKNKWESGPGIFWHRFLEYQKSRVRSKVEYPFFVIKRIFGYRKVRYRGLQKNRTQAYTLCALANLYMLAQSGFKGAT